MSFFRNNQFRFGRMSYFYQIVYYSIYLISSYIFQVTDGYSIDMLKPSKRLVRASDCRIYGLKITNCDIEVSRFGNERIRAVYEKTCNLKDVAFNFEFGKDGQYSFSIGTSEPLITVSAMKKKLENSEKVFSPGTHYISFAVQAKTLKNEQLSASSDKCRFYVRHENATANLGRLNRVVRSNTNVVVDARRSTNNDVEKRDKDLEYRWTCTDTSGFCQEYDLGTASRVGIPAEYVKDGKLFNFTVEVRSLPTNWQSAYQLISVDDAHPFSINCVQTCGKYPNTLSPSEFPVFLQECAFSCDKYDRDSLHGVIVDQSDEMIAAWDNFADAFRLKMNLPPGRNVTCKVYYGDINDGVQDENTVLKFSAQYLGLQDFRVLDYPKLENCVTIPPKGTPLTKFKVKCDYEVEARKNFEIQVISDDTVVFSASSPRLEDIEFLVSSEDALVAIKLEDIHDVFIIRNITVNIESLIPEQKDTSAAEHLNDIYEGKVEGTDSVSNLIKAGEQKKAVQIIDVVARGMAKVDITSEEEKDRIKNVKKSMLNDMGKMHIEDIDLSKSVSGVMKLLATDQLDNISDPDMAKLLTESCGSVAKQQIFLLQNDLKEDINANEVIDITRNLMSCGESETSPYYEIFNETATDLEITTPYPINQNLSENNFEDYPQYVADDLIEQKVNDFLAAAQNMVDICREMGDSLAYSLQSDMSEPTYIARERSIVSVIKTTGSKIVDATFQQHNVTINPPFYLRRFQSTLSMRVCSYLNDPFWSVSKDYKIPTNVIDISVRNEKEDKAISRFESSPMNVTFDVFGDLVKKKLSKGTVRSPNESSEFKEDEFTIFMINARSQESFFIDFHDLSDTDRFEVVVIPMGRPQLTDFSDSLHINHNNNKYFVQHTERTDKWFMLGVRPGKGMPADKEIHIDFAVYTPMCVSWNDASRSWKFACSVYLTTTPKTINCQCMHLSTIAGAFEYNDLKIHPKFIHLDFELEEAQSFFIVMSVCILIGVYFFLLVYSVQKNETLEDAVYLMADVPADNRFAYLVVVYTGGRIDAGTSSEVVVKLFGSEGCSQEHVVNFPDPLMELLQRTQKDYFVLATPIYLGVLQKIHIWYDCTGISPNWYCNKIRVCDMQTKEWSAFKVNKWFKIDGKPRLFISVIASSDKEDVNYQKKKNRLIRSFLSFGRFDQTIWHMSTSTSNPNFAYPKRLTLILSVLITLMTVTMTFYGQPEFSPRDTITRNCYFKMRPSILYNGLYSALITFFPHLAVMEGFKNSRIQFQSQYARDAKVLPAAFTVFFWVVLIANITSHIQVLLIYGYKIIAPTTWEWMMSILFGFFSYVFILDYLYNIFLILVGGVVKPVRLNFEKIIRNIEEQRRLLYKFVGHYIYRPILGPVYELMTRADYMKKRIHFRQKREMVWQVQDFFMILTFILLLYIIVLGEKDSLYDFRGHEQAMKLIYGPPSQKKKLSTVNHIRDFENFVEYGFIPTMQSYQWYGRYISENPGMTSDASNKYLGVFRLRQHRVEEDSCNVTEQMQFLNKTCRSPDFFFRYDYLNYTPAWNNTIPEVHRSRLGYVWGHQSGVGKIFLGLAGFYESGGYVAELGRTIENSYVNFNYLKRYNWLNPLTRAVIVEFCLYNVNKNLFHFAEVVLEKTPAGYISKDVTAKTERVVKHSSKSQSAAMICSFIFMLLVLAMCIRTIIRIIKTKVWFKRDLWHIVDILIIILSFAWIGMYFRRLEVLRAFVNCLEESPSNTFVDYFPVLNVESWMRTLAAFLICVSTIRMWKVVRFGVIFRTVERTLMITMNSLCMMLLYYNICIVAFGVTFFIALGSKVEQFKDEYQVLKTLLSITIGVDKTKPNEVCLNERGLGYAFSILYSVFCQFSTTIFIAIIIFGYLKARQFAFEEKLDYNVKDYTKERLETLKRNAGILAQKFRLTAGGKPVAEEEMVSPKDDMMRYKNCVQTDSNRMKAMASVAKCVLLKMKKGLRLDESDHALMMRTVRNLCNKEEGEKEIFFMEGTKDSGLNMVDDRRILMMEKVVKRMLESPEMKAKREEVENLEEAMWADNLARMMKINYQLKLMSRAINNIEITMPSNRKVL